MTAETAPKIVKLLTVGVGGQGVVWLTGLLTEAAVASGLGAASSEIHGIAQRRGSVAAGVAFGDKVSGLVEEAQADFLIGLEPMEAMRCVPFLHTESGVILDDNRLLPHAVNAGTMAYPDVEAFVAFLRKSTRQVIFNRDFDPSLPAVLRNVFIIGRATHLQGFPLKLEHLKQAALSAARPGYEKDTLRALELGVLMP